MKLLLNSLFFSFVDNKKAVTQKTQIIFDVSCVKMAVANYSTINYSIVNYTYEQYQQ